jgi:hypothetical protein
MSYAHRRGTALSTDPFEIDAPPLETEFPLFNRLGREGFRKEE